MKNPFLSRFLALAGFKCTKLVLPTPVAGFQPAALPALESPPGGSQSGLLRMLAIFLVLMTCCQSGFGVVPATGSAGSGAPIDPSSPSLGLQWVICINGLAPTRETVGNSSPDDATISEIRCVAFDPAGGNFSNQWLPCDGRLLPIFSYVELFHQISTIYGGDGITTFALPDLRGRVPVGRGLGPDGSYYDIGQTGGTESTTLSTAQMPAHTHTTPAGATGPTGGATPLSTQQPYLVINAGVVHYGSTYFSTGWVRLFACYFMPAGLHPCEGQLVPFNGNVALAGLIGTTYGGDGTTNIRMPNLAGRTLIGSGTGTGLTARTTGQAGGVASTTLTTTELPAHTHTLEVGNTGSTGSGAAFSTMGPFLTLNAAVATQGVPFQPLDMNPYIGEVRFFAGPIPVNDYAAADGAIQTAASNAALLAVLGNTYGGDGTTTFGLPDLRGRTAAGAGSAPGFTPRVRGNTWGAETLTLSTAQLPVHDHSPPVILSLTPNSGPTAGGTSVTITGTDFTGATAVNFGGTAASFTVNSDTTITATSSAGADTVDVQVTTGLGTSATSAADQFTYVPAPTVTSISPTLGLEAGGTTLTITGTHFSGTTAVKFGATAATTFTIISATSITATAPAGTGTVDVRVTTSGGTSATSATDQFTYVPPLLVVAPDDQIVSANTSTGALPFATSIDHGLTFSASSDNPALIPNSNVVFGGTGAAPTVTVTPAFQHAGTAGITITVSDGLQTASDTFYVSVPSPYPITGLIGGGLAIETGNTPPGSPNLALPVNGGTAFAKDVIPINPHQIGCLNDGLYGNANSWVGNTVSSFAGINLGGLKKINQVAFGRDNTGALVDLRWNGLYTIQYTTVANPDASTTSWTTIGTVDLSYAAYFPPPSILRHLFSFPPVMATGLRIITVAAAGSPHPLGIDELEIYNAAGPDIVIEQMAGDPLMPMGSLDFGQVTQFSARTVLLNINNPGSADLVLGALTRSGADSGDFTLGTPSLTTIPAGSSAILPVTFAPGALGVRSTTISIASNAAGVKALFPFNAVGTGMAISSPPAGISSGLTLMETGGIFAPDNLASIAAGGTAFAKDVLLINPHTIAGLNDGIYGNNNSWIGNTANSFAGINLGGLKRFDRIAFGRDNAIPQTQLTRAIGLYALQYTTANNPDASTTNWTTIGTVDLSNTTLFGTEASGGPAQRHLFSFAPVQATGMRIITVNDGACIDEIEIYPYFTPLETWRQTHFNTTANTGLAADNSDADKDGETNFAEFATGQNPTTGKRLGMNLTPNGSNWNLTFTRSIAAIAAGVTFDVEMSDTLAPGSWTTIGIGVPVVLIDNGLTQQVQVIVPTGGQLRRFFRLRITD